MTTRTQTDKCECGRKLVAHWSPPIGACAQLEHEKWTETSNCRNYWRARAQEAEAALGDVVALAQDLFLQFCYRCDKQDGVEWFQHGGLSALEAVFAYWKLPNPVTAERVLADWRKAKGKE